MVEDIRYYESSGATAVRVPQGGVGVPEVYGPKAGAWTRYPDLDLYHDASPITRERAAALVGGEDNLNRPRVDAKPEEVKDDGEATGS